MKSENSKFKRLIVSASAIITAAAVIISVPLSGVSAKGLTYIGHRGGYLSSETEENSLDAFKAVCSNKNFDGFEFDIYETEKNLYKISHDEPVENKKYITMKEALNLAIPAGKSVYIHIKRLYSDDSTVANFYKNLNGIIGSKASVSRFHIMSRTAGIVLAANENRYPSVYWVPPADQTYSALTSALSKSEYKSLKEIIIPYGYINSSGMKTKIVNYCHNRNIKVLVYTNSVEYANNARLWNADGIISDKDIKESLIKNIKISVKSLTTSTKGNTVRWDETPGVTGYVIYRSENKTDYKKIRTVKSGGSTSYMDKSVKPNVKYYYKIGGYDDGYYSKLSNAKSVRTSSSCNHTKHTFKTVSEKTTYTPKGIKVVKELRCTVCGYTKTEAKIYAD